MVRVGVWRQMGIQGGRWDPLGRTEVVRAALVKVCRNAEPAFDILEQEAFEGRISLLMQELGEGEDHQCKGEAAERFWVVLLIKNLEKEKIQTKNHTWTGTSVLRVTGQSWHNWKMHVFLKRGKYCKTVPCINFFASLQGEPRKCNVYMWDFWSMAKFFLQNCIQLMYLHNCISSMVFSWRCVLERAIDLVNIYLHFNPLFCPTPN